MNKTFYLVVLTFFLLSVASVIAPDDSVPKLTQVSVSQNTIESDNELEGDNECLGSGKQCAVITTGSAQIDACCAGLSCKEGICGEEGPQCIPLGDQCMIYTTGSAQIDACCEGALCKDGMCVEKDNPGFIRRIWRAITGAPDDPEQLPECTEKTNVCYSSNGKVLCEDNYKECVAKYGQCLCGKPEESSVCPNGLLVCKSENGEVTRCQESGEQKACLEKYGKDACTCTQPTGETTTVDMPTIVDICNPCDTVICMYKDGSPFICPANLKECMRKFGDSCNIPGCYRELCTEKTHLCKQPQDGKQFVCEGTFEECNAKYRDGCICGNPEGCQEKIHTCYPEASDGMVPQPLACEGSYDVCVQKYGKCECGYELESICGENVQTCYPLAATGAVAAPMRCEGTLANCEKKYGKCVCGWDDGACVYEGAEIANGASWAAGDGCNTCSCQDGRVHCTERACTDNDVCGENVQTCYPLAATGAVAAPMKCEGTLANCEKKYGKCVCGWDDGACVYEGAEIANGASWAAGDGCNTCSCQNGRVHCTERACQVCEEKTNTCYPASETETMISPPVKCEDSYNNCVEKYGRCDCGYTEAVEAECIEMKHTCKDVTGASVTCEGTYDRCKAKYGSCSCGVQLVINPTALGKITIR